MSVGFVYHPREDIDNRIVGKGGTDQIWLHPQTDKLEHTFYVLDIYNTLLLHPNHIKNIPEEVLQKLSTGDWHLLIDCIEEYDIYKIYSYATSRWSPQQHMIVTTGLGRLVNFCNFLWDNYSIPHNHVHYASPFLYDNKMLDKLKVMNVTTDINFHFKDIDLIMYGNDTIDIKNTDIQYTYCALNAGNPRPAKIELIYQLWKNNLLDKGLVSLSKPKNNNYEKEFIDLLPIRERNKNKHWLQTKEQRQNTELHELKDIKIYISTETMAPDNHCQITEKTYRAIAYGKPFVIIGNKGSLSKLHNLGFKTFSGWWPEEYDTLEWPERIDYVINLLKNLPDLTGIEEITQFNLNHIRETQWEKMFKKSLINAKNS